MGEEIEAGAVLEVLAAAGRPVTRRTWHAYVARGQAPRPVRRVGRTPLWDEHEIRAWVEARPGPGNHASSRERKQRMITTEYGTWATAVTSPTTVEAYILVVLGDYADDYDRAAIAADLRAAVNEALPPGVTLNGNDFYGPHGVSQEDRPDLRAVVESVDFWAIADRHDQS